MSRPQDDRNQEATVYLVRPYYFCVGVLLLTAVADRVIWMKGVRTR